MAKRKNTLYIQRDQHISLIGISCHLKSYRLSFSINKMLNFRLQRIDDFEIPNHGGEDILGFPILLFNADEMKNHFCLISNHHPQRKLIPALRQVDYFLIAKNPIDKYTKEKILARLRNISQVVAAYEIDANGTKDLDVLLEEMELHLLMSQRKRTSAQA
ncbi:MAG: IPExxxVDY family protein [Bacteroidales bacterium]|nr:IPExxxVDY family protein [Bacteroidales bacterium]